MKSNLFYPVLVILAIAIFLTSCQESILSDLEEPNISGLFLHFSSEGELSSYYVDENGEVSKYYFPRHQGYVPNSLLFEINYGTVKVLNSYLTVKSFKVSSDGQEASFLIDTYLPTPSIYAFKIPFNRDDCGVQSEKGRDRFNGLLKVNFFVLAIKGETVLVYDIETDQVFESKGKFEGNSLIFQINSQECTLSFQQNSPIGNFFQFTINNEERECFTLMK
jgi:hypothetical protein